MSKLFDTLEKIRENEGTAQATGPGAGGPAPAPARSRRWLVVVLGVGIVATALYGILSRSMPPRPQVSARQEKALPAVAVPPVAKSGAVATAVGPSQATPPATGAGADDLARLNDLGAASVDRNQHWRGIYFFQQANAIAPGRLEPLVNLAVAYAELGLYRQANAYLIKAVAIDPQSKPLQDNLKILHRANLLDQALVAAMVPREPPPAGAAGQRTPGGHGVKRP